MNVICCYIILILKKIQRESTTNITDDKKDMFEIEQVALDDIIRLTGYYKKKLIKVKKEMINLKHHSRINENSNNRELKVDEKIAQRDDSGHQSFDFTLATSNENTQNEIKRYTPAKDCSLNTNMSDKILDNIQLKHMCSDKFTEHIQQYSHTHNNYANRYVNKVYYANNTYQPLSRNKTKSIILNDATATSKPLYDLNISDIIEKKLTMKLKTIDEKNC